MKINLSQIKDLINSLNFIPEDGSDNVYCKSFENHNNYTIKVDFNNEKIIYREDGISEENGIKLGDSTTSNFENSENFVVLECVNRILEKGYKPQSITLEKKYPLGRQLKGKLDIIISDENGNSYLMIECKTWGIEYDKERKKMIKDGGQLFSYYSLDRAAKYLCLYASRYNDNNIEYINGIISVEDDWSELSNTKEIHDHWNKNFNDNGIFEEWANTYDVEIKALVRGRLQPLTKDDSGRIFNQFAEILRHNVVSDKPNAFNKILNLFICKIIDEDKNDGDQVEFQWLEDDTDSSLQLRLNDLYKKGMHRFLDIEVTDFTESDISDTLINVNDVQAQKTIREMIIKLRLQKNPEFAFIEVYDESSFKRNARVVKEVVELLQPYQFRYGHKQQFLGDFFELLLNTSIKQEAGQYFTPVPITRYIVSSLPIKEFIESKLKTDDPNVLPTVIDFACGTGHFLTEFMDRVQNIIENEIDVKNAKPTARKKLNYWSGEDGKFEWASDFVYGIDADYRLVKSSKVSSFLNGDGEANIIRANGLDNFSNSTEYRGKLKIVSNDDSKDNGQFDILIANPPYSVNAFKSTVKYGEKSFELFNKLTDNSSEIECLFIERMKQLLKVGGYAGIILPSSILSNTGIYTLAREILLKHFKIIAITEFGSNTFMATGTNTVTLFLERRPNTDYKHIENAINSFFEKPKDVTVLGIEKAFSKYVSSVYDSIGFDDYASFISKKITDKFMQLEIYADYKIWFDNLTEVKNLKIKKAFTDLPANEQKQKLQNLFYEKVFEIEKDKMLYFLLVYGQKTVITKVGEKQAEKDFIGYEFSNRRGHEGIKMLPNGTKLYDENDCLNPTKANSYIYNAFIDKYNDIENSISDNISYLSTTNLIDFTNVQFEKIININSKKKINIWSDRYELKEVGAICESGRGRVINKQYISANAGVYPVYSSQTSNSGVLGTINTYDFDGEYVTWTTDGAKAGTVFYRNGKFNCTNVCGTLKSKSDLINMKYLSIALGLVAVYYVDKVGNNKLMNIDLEKIKIPVPPINVQEKIVSEIGSIEALETTNGDKITAIKSSLLAPEYFAYADERIEKIATMVQRGKSASYGTSNIQIIKSGQARGYNEFDFSQKYFVADNFISDERNLKKGDVLINSTGVGTAGRVTLFDLDGDYVVDSHITIVRLDQTKIIPKYAMYALANIGFKNIEALANGQSGQIELALSTINAIRIPLPPLSNQKEIVSQIEKFEDEIQKLEDEIAMAEEQKKAVLDKYLK